MFYQTIWIKKNSEAVHVFSYRVCLTIIEKHYG